MTLILCLLAFALGVLCDRLYLAAKGEEQAPPHFVLPPPTQRCYTITYTYSDGTTITKHRCQGWQEEFTDAVGRTLAPAGATLVSTRGGVHK